MTTIIETPRLRLRTWEDADVRPFDAACNTPAVTRWLGGVQPLEASRAAAARMRAMQEAQGFCFWLVERIADGELLGFCGLKSVRDAAMPFDRDVEIGWRLREAAWGQGYAKEAAQACLAWAWEHLDVDRIVAITVPANVASWGLMARLGMTRRADLAFAHPAFAPDHELSAHITYVIERPA